MFVKSSRDTTLARADHTSIEATSTFPRRPSTTTIPLSVTSCKRRSCSRSKPRPVCRWSIGRVALEAECRHTPSPLYPGERDGVRGSCLPMIQWLNDSIAQSKDGPSPRPSPLIHAAGGPVRSGAVPRPTRPHPGPLPEGEGDRAPVARVRDEAERLPPSPFGRGPG